MKWGHINARQFVLLLNGAAGSGKSHFKHLIFKLPPPEKRHSTPLAEYPVRAICVWKGVQFGENNVWQKVGLSELLPMVADAIKVEGSTLDSTEDSVANLGNSSDDGQAQVGEYLEPQEIGLSLNEDQDGVASSTPKSFQSSTPPLLSEPLSSLEEQLLDLISKSSGSELLFNADWVYVIDSGGQPQFLELLPAFVPNSCACIFVTKLNEELGHHPKVEYFDDGEECGQAYESPLSHEGILSHCCRTMQSRPYTSSKEEDASIFIVGTHADEEHNCGETRATKNQKLLAMLRPLFGKNINFYDIANDDMIYPVNAKTPDVGDRKVAEEFRKAVIKHCPVVPEKIPLPWFILEQMLHEVASTKNVKVLHFDECQQIAHRLQINKSDFQAALLYLVHLNLFLYYPDSLPNIVFCDSQVLLDKISELVKYSHTLQGKPDCSADHSPRGLGGEWLDFRDSGIVTERLLKEFPKHYRGDLFSPSDLLKLLADLSIAAHLKESQYFMPALLESFQNVKFLSIALNLNRLLPHFLCAALMVVGCLAEYSLRLWWPYKTILGKFP